jgi:hypothetical protein
MDTTMWLLVAALIGNGLLVGASLDQTVKQLPTRHRIGVVAFSEYSKAGDLGRGVAWYAALGIGAALLTLAAAVVGRAHRGRALAGAGVDRGALAGHRPGGADQLQPARRGR